MRNQLVLNLARNDVKEHIFAVLDKLASENNIRYFKWDMNRSFSEPGWPEAGASDQKKLWVDYVRNLYDIIDRLRAKHPKLEVGSCSGGGERIDLGILQRTMRFGLPIISRPSIGFAFRKDFRRSLRRKLCPHGLPTCRI